MATSSRNNRSGNNKPTYRKAADGARPTDSAKDGKAAGSEDAARTAAGSAKADVDGARASKGEGTAPARMKADGKAGAGAKAERSSAAARADVSSEGHEAERAERRAGKREAARAGGRADEHDGKRADEHEEKRAEKRAGEQDAERKKHAHEKGAHAKGSHAEGSKGKAAGKAEGKAADAKAAGESSPRVPHIDKKRRPIGIIIGALVACVLVAVGVGFGIAGQGGEPGAGSDTALDFADAGYNEAGELINPVNWDEWQGRNPDVYAWLQIDGTKVDYPILQHPVVDDYYLMRNIDGEPEVNGALYTQISHNSKDFESDPVTIIYGHTFEQKDTMFTTLHNLEDDAVFESVPTFYVYTPEERLEYEIVSAFEYDNSHILETQDMTDPAVRAAFFDMVQNPDSINKDVRKLKEKLDPDEDNLLILSTCTQPANDNARYLVVAVLRSVEQTEDVDLSTIENGVIEEHVLTQEELDALPDAE